MRISSFLRRRPIPAAFITLGLGALFGLLLYFKQDLVTRLSPGDTLTVRFAENYQIRPNETAVKIAGSEVGRVQSVERSGGAPVDVVLKVSSEVRELLGSTPSAVLRPTTILGGRYYIELRSGGTPGEFGGDAIPSERTTVPVELDKVLAAIPPDAQQGLQGMTERLDSTFKAGAGADLKQLLRDAPDTLRPTGVVLEAARGVNKDTDLATLATTANTAAAVLSAKPGQLRAVVDSLAGTAKVFGDNAAPVARTLADLPDTLRETRAGASDLSNTLRKLTDTADDARPIVQELDPTLEELDPLLADLRPVAADLRQLLAEARPLLRALVPTVDRGTDVLAGARGKPLDRVNGPILTELNREWKGSEPKFPNGGRDGAKFYQELMQLLTNLNGMTQYATNTTHLLGFQAVAGGTGTIWGTGPQAEALQKFFERMWGIPHQGPNGGSANPPLVPGTGQGFRVPLPDPGTQPPVLDPNGLLGKGPNR